LIVPRGAEGERLGMPPHTAKWPWRHWRMEIVFGTAVGLGSFDLEQKSVLQVELNTKPRASIQ